MTTVVPVTRTERAAARLRRELDKRAERKTDPRVDVIADATVRPVTVNGKASVGSPVVVSHTPPADLDETRRAVDGAQEGILITGMPDSPTFVEKVEWLGTDETTDEPRRHGKK